MARKTKNHYSHLTRDERITAHTVLFNTNPDDPINGRFVKASLWVDKGIVSSIFEGKAPAVVPGTVHLRHHVTRAEFSDVMAYRYQIPRRAERDRSTAARSTQRSVGQGHHSGSMAQFAVGGQVINEPNWVTLGEILTLRQGSDHGFPFSIQGLTWTKNERELMTDYLRRYFGADA